MHRYIDAEALDAYVTYDRCNLCKKYFLDRDGVKCKYCMIQWFLDAIDRHKTVNVRENKHGKWIVIFSEDWCTFDEFKCSICGCVEYFNKGWKKFSYCPNCGAKMDEMEAD